MSIEVTGLHYYPIKSCAASDLQAAEINERGIRYDREWMIVDEKGKFMSQRQNPEMAQITPFIDEALSVCAPGIGELVVPLLHERDDDELVEVSVHSREFVAQNQGEDAEQWFSDFFQAPARLVRVRPDLSPFVKRRYHFDKTMNQLGFADAFPFTLASEKSLKELNTLLAEPVPMNRFRPNIVVDGNIEAYDEDFWRHIRIGNLSAYVVKACDRCPIPDTDQNTGARGTEVRKALGRSRKGVDITSPDTAKGIFFAQNLLHEFVEGTVVSLGDPVTVEGRSMKPNFIASE